MKSLRQLTTYLLIVFLGTLSLVANAQQGNRDEVVFFFNDALGSAVAAINEQGELCWSEEYTGYGDKTINDDLVSPVGCGIIGEERGFTGHTEDVNSDLVYMQQRYYDPSIGRFLSIDPLDADPENPMTHNRYAYGNNNPYKYTDPDGRVPFLAIGVAVVGAGLTAYETYNTYQTKGAGAAVGSLVSGAALTVAGTGAAKATGLLGKKIVGFFTKTDATADVANRGQQLAANSARGRASEARVLDDLGLEKNTRKVTGVEGNSIPDALTDSLSVEIKDAKNVSLTRQLRIQTEAARASGRQSTLVTGQNTCVSGSCQRAFDQIIRRSDLGPSQ